MELCRYRECHCRKMNMDNFVGASEMDAKALEQKDYGVTIRAKRHRQCHWSAIDVHAIVGDMQTQAI